MLLVNSFVRKLLVLKEAGKPIYITMYHKKHHCKQLLYFFFAAILYLQFTAEWYQRFVKTYFVCAAFGQIKVFSRSLPIVFPESFYAKTVNMAVYDIVKIMW